MEVLLPIAILSGAALLTYIVGRLSRSRMLTGFVAFVAVLGAAHAVYQVWAILEEGLTIGWPVSEALRPLQAYVTGNHLGIFLAATALLLSLMVVIYSMRYMHRRNIGKFYALLLLMTAGIVGIGFAGDLFTMFVLFEAMSVASFVLVAFEREEWEPVEAGVTKGTRSFGGTDTDPSCGAARTEHDRPAWARRRPAQAHRGPVRVQHLRERQPDHDSRPAW